MGLRRIEDAIMINVEILDDIIACGILMDIQEKIGDKISWYSFRHGFADKGIFSKDERIATEKAFCEYNIKLGECNFD